MHEEVQTWILQALHTLGGHRTPREVVEAVRGDHDIPSIRVTRALWDLIQAKEVEFTSPETIRIVPGTQYELQNGETHGED